MTKKDLVHQISEDIGVAQLQVKDVVQRTLDSIVRTLVLEGRIELRNFGVFEVRRRPPRKARNPRTGEKVIAPAKNVVSFKPGREMEKRVGREGEGRHPQADSQVATDQPEPGRSPGSSPRPKRKLPSNPSR